MSAMRVFRGITPEILTRLQQQKAGGGYVLDLEPGGSGGRLSGRTAFGEVVVRFDYNTARSELTVTILKKPAFMPSVALWAEMSNALETAAAGSR
jgi:hypothetical protein